MAAPSPRIPGMHILHHPVHDDPRGSFSEYWNVTSSPDKPAFLPQSAAVSRNISLHTLRGMHYQESPHAQTKWVTCVSGFAWDVVLDLRPDSPAYLQWEAVELRAGSGKSVYVPKGCAHGFVTLEADTVLTYLIEGPYTPSASKVVRWNDPRFAIAWPVKDPVLSERDQLAPDFIF